MIESAKNDSEPIAWARAGAWLFRQRTWIPVPLALVLLGVPASAGSSDVPIVVGIFIVIGGEVLRLWAVHHIGAISRTRSDRLGPLVSSGPFAIVRNPLYLGNIALWVGFAVTARLVWAVPLFIAVLGAEYHAIVRWEEHLLEARRGEEYRAYAARVPRWIPGLHSGPPVRPSAHSWGDTLFSERGTLIAIAAGGVLVWLKSQS